MRTYFCQWSHCLRLGFLGGVLLALVACGATSTGAGTHGTLTTANQGAAIPPPGPPLHLARIRATQDVGIVAPFSSNLAVAVTAFDGGVTMRFGQTLVWWFGDTLFHPAGVDGANLRSNTLAAAGLTTPTHLQLWQIDANGAPLQGVPFTAEELAYNLSKHNPNDRIAIWPGSALPDGNGGYILLCGKIKINPGTLNYTDMGVVIARVPTLGSTPTRDIGTLFAPTEPLFTTAVVDPNGSFVYVYASQSGGNIVVGRAPTAQATTRSAYTFWNGSVWVADIAQVKALLTGVPLGSVSYNSYLHTYMMVYSLIDNTTQIRLATAPQGPWGPAVTAFTGGTPASLWDYYAIDHPELAQNGGKTIFISYVRPSGPFALEMHLVRVDFR